jgi:hypothetical protein
VDAFTIVSEDRIKRAIEDGEFSNLPGKRKPLKLDDMSVVPEELRMGYKLLKNANYVPDEVELKKEIMRLEDLIACCYNDVEKNELRKKLNEKQLKLDMLLKKRPSSNSAAMRDYKSKIDAKCK